jgi:hypothetical protein
MMTLEDVKRGDLLILHGRAERYVVTVERVTARYIVIGRERYRKGRGFKVGESGFWRSLVSIPKDGEVAEVRTERRKRALIYKLQTVKWSDVSLEKLVAIEALL